MKIYADEGLTYYNSLYEMLFDEQTTTQLAAYFLKKHGGEMNYLKLIKLLYFADREHIKRAGSSITKDPYYSMTKTPVLSKTYDLIRSDLPPPSYWNNVIETSNYKGSIIEDPNYDSLRQVLYADAVFEKFGDLDKWGSKQIFLINFQRIPSLTKAYERRLNIKPLRRHYHSQMT